MPRYDFECTECHKKFELNLKMADKDNQDAEKRQCPHCHSKKLKQIISFNGGISTGSSSTTMPSCPTGTCPFAK